MNLPWSGKKDKYPWKWEVGWTFPGERTEMNFPWEEGWFFSRVGRRINLPSSGKDKPLMEWGEGWISEWEKGCDSPWSGKKDNSPLEWEVRWTPPLEWGEGWIYHRVRRGMDFLEWEVGWISPGVRRGMTLIVGVIRGINLPWSE